MGEERRERRVEKGGCCGGLLVVGKTTTGVLTASGCGNREGGRCGGKKRVKGR